MTFIFLIIFTALNAVAAESTIKVLTATWSGTDVTSAAVDFCDGKPTCSYRVSRRFVGRPVDENNRSFTIVWTCSNHRGITHSLQKPHDAEHQVLDLRCDQVVSSPEPNPTNPSIPAAPAAPLKPSNSPAPTPAPALGVAPSTVSRVSPQPGMIPGANPGVENYYQDLVRKHRAGQKVQLEDFNRTFFLVPELSPSQDNTLRCANEIATGGCRPDTYYSWGPIEKAQSIGRNSPTGKVWQSLLNSSYSIYMNHSSLGSYCYGRYPVRFKFREPPSASSLNTTVMNSNFNEWILSSYGNLADELRRLESVSFGQPEHFDEIVTEIQRRMDPIQNWHEAPLYVPPLERSNLKSKLLSGCVAERLPMNEGILVENLVLFLEVIFKNQGWIHYNNCSNCNSANHFQTNWPTFFNPK